MVKVSGLLSERRMMCMVVPPMHTLYLGKQNDRFFKKVVKFYEVGVPLEIADNLWFLQTLYILSN